MKNSHIFCNLAGGASSRSKVNTCGWQKKSSTTGKCNFQARIFKHWELKRTTTTISLMHFFKTFVYSDTLQTFLSHLHNLFRVRRPSSAPYLNPLSNDWHSVGIDGLNCGQRLLEGIDRRNLYDFSDADLSRGSDFQKLDLGFFLKVKFFSFIE